MSSYYEKFLATGEVKCIDEEIPFEIPQGWEWTRIGNIFNHTSGKQQSGSNKNGGTPQKFITTSNLYWGYFILDNVKVMNFTEEEIKTCSATKGDLLVCEGGAGYSIIFKGDDNKYYEQVNKKCLDITEQIPFEIPENWVWVRMGQIGNWGAGSTPQRGDANYYNGKILWLKTGELNNGIVYDTEEKVTQKAFQDCSLRMNKIGDVLIAMYTIGKLAIVGKELTTNQACCGCTPYLIYNWYLFYFLMASRDSFIKKGEGGAQPNISRVKLVEHLIPLPPLKEQYRIVTQIEKLFEQLR